MKAFFHENGALHYGTIDAPTVHQGQVMIQLKTAGLNRRDLSIPRRRGEAKEPLILGSDGAGVIIELGEGVQGWSLGDEVILNPSLRWKSQSSAPPEGFDILGMPDHGTFAEKIVIAADQIEKKPTSLSWEEAAALPLAALTGYRALFTQGQIQKGETVFIPGAGSGVATFLIQFAKSVGARVIVSSRMEEKRRLALAIGADRAIDTAGDWVELLKDEQIDLVIDSVGRATFNRSLEVLKKGGRIVIFGATTEDVVEFDLRSFFYGQYHLIGSTMGSQEEFRKMLHHVAQHKLKPVIDRVFPLHEAEQAFQRLRDQHQFGKVILKIHE